MTIQLEKIETLEAPNAIGPYSQAVKAGHLLFVSGQLPVDASTGQLVESDIRVQTNRSLDNLEAILKEGGSSLKQVVRTDVFLKNLDHFKAMNEEYAKRFDQPIPPARQTIQAAKLPLDCLVEISCIAIVS